MLTSLLLVTVTLALAVAVCATDEKDVIIDALRKRLALTSEYIGVSRPLMGDTFKNQCSCEEYCTGRCFSIMCAPCSPDAFSFPGGESLCLSVGPLGTGLLCHVDPQSGNVTQNACCNENGPTCWLPENSCCSAGDCTTCPTSSYSNNLTLLYPPLRRIFTNDSCEAF